MATRKIVKIGDETLRKVCRPQQKFDLRLAILLKDLADTMYKSNGVGLAAPQVGIMRRMFVAEPEPEEVYYFVDPDGKEYTRMRQTLKAGAILAQPESPSDGGRTFDHWTLVNDPADPADPALDKAFNGWGVVTVPELPEGRKYPIIRYLKAVYAEDVPQIRVTYYDQNGTYVEGTVQTATNSYSYNRIIVLDATQDFNSTPTQAQLNTYASTYLTNNPPTPSVSVDVEFVPLWQTEEYKEFYGLEHVGLCDTVEVIYPPLNIDVKAKVVRTVYNVLADRYDELTISTIKPTLADTIFNLMEV